MSYVPFITTQDLKDNAVVQQNFQSDLIYPYIQPGQEIVILRVLGTPQYEEVANSITAAGSISGVTGNTALLIDKIKLPLIYATAYYATPFLHVRVTNKGMVYKQSPEQSVTASDNAVNKIRAEFENFYQFYTEELKRFLRNNQTIFPLWREEYFANYEQYSGATYSRGSTGYQGPVIFSRSHDFRQDLLGG